MTAAVSTRRAFVRACAGACAGGGAAVLTLAAAGCAAAVVTHVAPVNGRVRLRLADHPQLARPGGTLRVLPTGFAEPIFVLRQDDGTFVALSSECTHRGCTVNAEGARLVCPCHGSVFDRAGAVLNGPAARPLARFPTTLDGNAIEIAFGANS